MKRADKVTVKKRRRGWAVVGTPRVAVDRTEIDLGRLPFEQPARATFTLVNAGDGTLTLDGSNDSAAPERALLVRSHWGR